MLRFNTVSVRSLGSPGLVARYLLRNVAYAFKIANIGAPAASAARLTNI
jgi:hypothetical protein